MALINDAHDISTTYSDFEGHKPVPESDSSLRVGEVEDTGAEDRKIDRLILWKRDRLLVPMFGSIYLVMFLDRTNIANARIEGLEDDLNMPENGYSAALWVFYIPFVLAEVPSNLLLNTGKISPRWFLGMQMLALGIISTCQGLARSYGVLLALRFLMGIFEAALPAGATYMLSRYYTKQEAAPRFAWFFNFALAGPMFSGLLAYAIENLDGRGGYDGWRWIFIIEGLTTIIIAGTAMLILPEFPENAQRWFLEEFEQQRLVAMLEASRGDEKCGSPIENTPLWKVLVDWRIHLFTICFFCVDITASSVADFTPTILTQLQWTSTTAQLVSMPIWAAGIISTFVVTTLSTRLDIRWPFMLGSTCLQLVGWVIMRVYVPQPAVRYAGLFFMSIGTFPQMPILMAWLSANLRGRQYLAAGMAWMVGFGNCANFVSSNVFVKAESPKYQTGFSTGLSITCVHFALICLGTMILILKNKKRDIKRASLDGKGKHEYDQLHFEFYA